MSGLLKFADPIAASTIEECLFYHSFDLPDGRSIRSGWDLRQCRDSYIGTVDYLGKSVIEIGPASGFLTVALEKRGASVVSIENSPSQLWEFVPRSDTDVEQWLITRRAAAPRLFKSWWYTQRVFGCSARIIYCGASALTDLADLNLAHFDVCFIGGILQHVRHPVDMLWNASRLADTVVVSERYLPHVEAMGNFAEFVPARGKTSIDTWWFLSSTLVRNAMDVFGLELVEERRFNARRWTLDTAWQFEDDTSANDGFREIPHYNMIFRRRRNELPAAEHLNSAKVHGEIPDGTAEAQAPYDGEFTEFDEQGYLNRYPDVAQAVKEGRVKSGLAHYLEHGRNAGRVAVLPKRD